MAENEIPVGHAAPYNHMGVVCITIQMKQHLHQKWRVIGDG